MSAATSPGTGLAYGAARVCAAWDFARSSFYALKSRQHATAERRPAKRRGPKPSISDQALLVAIEADLEVSPWEGEGHRKVWARLRVCRGIRVARKRVLRVMRENNLLSPHRCRRRGGNPHDGEIITHAPNLMWGTDGVRVFTVDDGWGWIFTAIDSPYIGSGLFDSTTDFRPMIHAEAALPVRSKFIPRRSRRPKRCLRLSTAAHSVIIASKLKSAPTSIAWVATTAISSSGRCSESGIHNGTVTLSIISMRSSGLIRPVTR